MLWGWKSVPGKINHGWLSDSSGIWIKPEGGGSGQMAFKVGMATARLDLLRQECGWHGGIGRDTETNGSLPYSIPRCLPA